MSFGLCCGKAEHDNYNITIKIEAFHIFCNSAWHYKSSKSRPELVVNFVLALTLLSKVLDHQIFLFLILLNIYYFFVLVSDKMPYAGLYTVVAPSKIHGTGRKVHVQNTVKE